MKVNVIRPLQKNGTSYPNGYQFGSGDYVSVSHVDIRGEFKVREIVSADTTLKLAMLANRLEGKR